MNFHLVKYEMSCGLANQLPQSTLPEVVFAGRSNVGKSSLINKIFNQKQLARVSATPGKTATINFVRCAMLPALQICPATVMPRSAIANAAAGPASSRATFIRTGTFGWCCPFLISATPPVLTT